MSTTNLKTNEATPFVTKADFEDFLASYKTDLDAIKTDLEACATKTDLEAFATKISKTLLDALAADKEDRFNSDVMLVLRMEAFENQLNSLRTTRYEDSDDEVQ